MKDADFKNYNHCIGDLQITSWGQEVSTGYKPDLTIRNSNGKLMFIVECEQKTDRKAFLGGLIKAEKYAEDIGETPGLVFVMQSFDNTTVQQIGTHLKPYLSWLSKRQGGLRLSRVVVISDVEYKNSVINNEIICSPSFLKRAFIVAP